jgi:uncharacterized small protein (TIGR04563 family)
VSGLDKRKQSLYFPTSVLREISEQADRLDRSLSWVVQYAWKHGKKALDKLPSMETT